MQRGSVTEMPTDASGQRRGIPAKAWHPCQGVASLPRRGIPAKAWRRGALPVTIRLLTRLGICLTVAAGRGDQRGQATDLQAAAAARRERSKTTSIAQPKDTATVVPQDGVSWKGAVRGRMLTTWLTMAVRLLFACVYAVFAAVVPVPPALRPKDTAAFLPQGGAAVRVSIRTTWLTTWLAISSTDTAAVMPRGGASHECSARPKDAAALAAVVPVGGASDRGDVDHMALIVPHHGSRSNLIACWLVGAGEGGGGWAEGGGRREVGGRGGGGQRWHGCLATLRGEYRHSHGVPHWRVGSDAVQPSPGTGRASAGGSCPPSSEPHPPPQDNLKVSSPSAGLKQRWQQKQQRAVQGRASGVSAAAGEFEFHPFPFVFL
ncbi:unnamed protein product [Closterium sp. NIES-64]|nr:unnamed protein product [Closterium sp. NIES-64]